MSTQKTDTRSIELEVKIDAPVEHVWTALSDPEQLANWFPLTSKGTKGKGGQVSFSWGSAMEWTTTIGVWEPNKHIRFVDPPMAEGVEPTAVDFRIETDGGSTIVRLVNSGFSADSEWDAMFDQMSSGWAYFMFNLQWYLERHFDVRRDMVWVRRRTTKTASDIWPDVLGKPGFGFGANPDSLVPSTKCSSDVLAENIEGHVHMNIPGVHFACTVDTLDNGLLFIELEPGKDARTVGIWLSTYGLAPQRVSALQKTMDDLADRLFGPADSS